MLPDFTSEIQFRFSRSGGKGGQNVNKVETAATGFWSIASTRYFSEVQVQQMLQKLQHRLNAEGELIIKSQTHRSQAANRREVLEKFLQTVTAALAVKKPRIATAPAAAVREKRLASKKMRSEIKQMRNKQNW